MDPQPLRKKIADILDQVYENSDDDSYGDKATKPKTSQAADAALVDKPDTSSMAADEVQQLIDDMTAQMGEAARALKFELAGRLRDEIVELRKELRGLKEAGI